jgi:hypothetical protein
MDEIESDARALTAQEARWLTKLAAFDRSDEWRAAGYLSSTSALRSICRMSAGVARSHIVLARKLDQLPVVAEALGTGAISRAHASVIATAFTKDRAEELSTVEPELVAFAGISTPRELDAAVQRLTDQIDGDGGAASEEAAYEKQKLHLSETTDGFDVRGHCDRPTGLALDAVLKAEMERDREKADPRPTPTRRMDALGNLARGWLNHGMVGESHGVRPHITVRVDLDDLPGLNAQRKIEVRAEARTNGYLSPATLECLSCDASISRIIMSGISEILDVGRATRTISIAIWKALVARDQHCQHPGCDRPPEMCEGHHIIHWEHGGPTCLENLMLLCWNHHRERHRHDARAQTATPEPSPPSSRQSRSPDPNVHSESCREEIIPGGIARVACSCRC